MATSRKKIEVITEVGRCKEVVRALDRYDVIAVDAEGVQLGIEGPLTLLQIGTIDHQVFLFDIHTNKSLFSEGRLQDVLKSTRIKKVIHSCSGDSAALYYQFNIRLRNVFDTQVAHLVIEEHKGRELPSMLKLEDLCEKYAQKANVSDQKDSLKDKLVREVGDLWARRPLTDDMISYAAGDVIAIIPEVYDSMKRYIEDNGLDRKFTQRVEEEIEITFDEKAKEQKKRRLDETTSRVLNKMALKYDHKTFKDIDDEDFKTALSRIHFSELEKFPHLIKKLKTEFINAKLDEIEADFAQEDGIFQIINGHHDMSLKTGHSYPDASIKERTQALQDKVVKITLEHISKKYDVTSPANYLSRHEKDCLTWMRPYPSGEHDPRYHRVVLALYWKLMEFDLDKKIQEFRQGQRDFVLHEDYFKKLKFYMNKRTPVPESIKRKALDFVRSLEAVFGRDMLNRKT